jgi:hypothetical protein
MVKKEIIMWTKEKAKEYNKKWGIEHRERRLELCRKSYRKRSVKINRGRSKDRLLRKQKYVDVLGSKCSVCDYDRCIGALHFHHIDPSKKLFGVAEALNNKKYSEEEIMNEVLKCRLLCANYHAEFSWYK